MPINTRTKRASCLGVGAPYRGSYPVPSGAIGAPQRRRLTGNYAFEAGPPPTPSLVISDNGDGSGGVATISGTSMSSINTLYYATFTGSTGAFTWNVWPTVRGGDGTIAVGLAPGAYFFQAVSAVSGVESLPSNLVYATLTGPVVAATTLLSAVVNFFNASTLPALFPSKLWVEEVPEEKTFPLLTIWHYGEVPGETTEGDYLEVSNIGFELFAVGLAAAESLALAIKKVFDPLCQTAKAQAALVITNAMVVKCERTDYKVTTVEGRDANQNKVYQITIPYTCEVRKTLGVS